MVSWMLIETAGGLRKMQQNMQSTSRDFNDVGRRFCDRSSAL